MPKMKVEKLKIFGGIKVKEGALHKQLGYPLDKKTAVLKRELF